MAARNFSANVISQGFGSFQPRLASFGTTLADAIRAEDDPSQSDIYATLRAIFKQNKAMFSWFPGDHGRHATLFRDVMKEKEVFHQFIFMLTIEGYPEQRGYLKGATVKSVWRDVRYGDEVVTLVCKSAGSER